MISTLAQLVRFLLLFFFEDKIVNKTLAPLSAAAAVVDVNDHAHVAPHKGQGLAATGGWNAGMLDGG